MSSPPSTTSNGRCAPTDGAATSPPRWQRSGRTCPYREASPPAPGTSSRSSTALLLAKTHRRRRSQVADRLLESLPRDTADGDDPDGCPVPALAALGLNRSQLVATVAAHDPCTRRWAERLIARHIGGTPTVGLLCGTHGRLSSTAGVRGTVGDRRGRHEQSGPAGPLGVMDTSLTALPAAT